MSPGFLAIHGEVFGSGDGFEIFGVISLQSSTEGDAQLRCETRIFAVGFFTAPPARIAIHIDGRRPDDNAAVCPRFAAHAGVAVAELGAALISRSCSNFSDQVRIPRRPHADGLRKDGGAAIPRDAMKALRPPVYPCNAEPRIRRHGHLY